MIWATCSPLFKDTIMIFKPNCSNFSFEYKVFFKFLKIFLVPSCLPVDSNCNISDLDNVAADNFGFSEIFFLCCLSLFCYCPWTLAVRCERVEERSFVQSYFCGLISKVFLWPHNYFWGLVLTIKRNIRPKKDKGSQQLDKQPALVEKKQKFLCRGKSSKNWVGIVVAWCQVSPSTPPTANFFACLLIWTKSAILIYILCNGCSSADQPCWRCSENAKFRNLPTFVVHWLQQIWGNCGGIKRSGASPQPTHWGVPNPLNADGRREAGGGDKRQKHVPVEIEQPILA